MRQIFCTRQDFSRQKTQYIFESKPDITQKHRHFFLRTIFPPKDLVFFQEFVLGPIQKREIFPAKRLRFFFNFSLFLDFPAKRLTFFDFFPTTIKTQAISSQKTYFFFRELFLQLFFQVTANMLLPEDFSQLFPGLNFLGSFIYSVHCIFKKADLFKSNWKIYIEQKHNSRLLPLRQKKSVIRFCKDLTISNTVTTDVAFQNSLTRQLQKVGYSSGLQLTPNSRPSPSRLIISTNSLEIVSSTYILMVVITTNYHLML